MRSLLMASAALMFSTGLAMAQTTTSAPAPTGAPAAPAVTKSGSPGNMAPANSAGGQGMMSPTANAAPGSSAGSSSTASSAPAPTGAPNAAPTTPSGSPGNMAPSKSASASMGSSTGAASSGQNASNSMTPAAPAMHRHHSFGIASLPANASARTYLHIAKTAIRRHDVARADDALSHAETRMLTRAVPASASSMADSSPGVTAIENARTALRSGNYAEASSDVDTAMQNLHGGTGENGSMGGTAVMGNDSMDDGAQGGGMGNSGGAAP